MNSPSHERKDLNETYSLNRLWKVDNSIIDIPQNILRLVPTKSLGLEAKEMSEALTASPLAEIGVASLLGTNR